MKFNRQQQTKRATNNAAKQKSSRNERRKTKNKRQPTTSQPQISQQIENKTLLYKLKQTSWRLSRERDGCQATKAAKRKNPSKQARNDTLKHHTKTVRQLNITNHNSF
jgi:hypothetical protein